MEMNNKEKWYVKYQNIIKSIDSLNINSIEDYNYLVKNISTQVESIDTNEPASPYFTLSYLEGTDDYSLLANHYNKKLDQFIDNFFWKKKCLAYKMSPKELSTIDSFYLLRYLDTKTSDWVSKYSKISIIRKQLEQGVYNNSSSKDGCVFTLVFICVTLLIFLF